MNTQSEASPHSIEQTDFIEKRLRIIHALYINVFWNNHQDVS